MVSTRTLLTSMFALATFAGTASAQTELIEAESSQFKKVLPMKNYVYDFANRKVLKNATPEKRAIATFCYVNTDTVGIFISQNPGNERIDWGILGGTATTKCLGLSDIVTNFNFAYASSTPDTSVGGPGAALTLTFYNNWQGFGADSGNCPVASFAFTGLPGFSGSSTGIGSGYGFTVNLAGLGEFCMPDGQFGYGMRSNAAGNDVGTGPLFCLAGDGMGGAEACTGNPDVYDLWQPDTKGINAGSFFFNGPPNNFGSFYGTIARADLSGSPASVSFRDGGGTNLPGSIDASTPLLGSSLDMTAQGRPGDNFVFFIAFDTPLPTPVILGGGQALLCLDFGSGELLSGAGLAGAPVGGDQFVASTPLGKNVNFCGFTMCLFALTAQLGVPPFALTSAADLVVGG